MENKELGDVKTVAVPREQAAQSEPTGNIPLIGTSVPGMLGATMPEYSPEAISAVAEVLAPQAGNYTNALASQIGQAQQSMGPLAAATMGTPVQGLGNYTYNRLVRPQVDVMRDEILVQGYTNSLNKLLSDALRQARKNYNKSTNSSDKKSNSDGPTVEDEYKDDDTTGNNSGKKVGSKKFAGSGKPKDGLSDEEKAKKAGEWAELYRNTHYPGMYGGF